MKTLKHKVRLVRLMNFHGKAKHDYTGNIFDFLINKFRNDYRLAKLKNCHSGKRAFVIGSGPSLKIEDLDSLKNEITFACNKIYLAFSQTSWRPTYCSVIDRIVARNNSEEIKNMGAIKIFSRTVKSYFKDSRDIIWLRDLKTPLREGRSKYQFSTNLRKGTFGGYTVLYTLLQIAFYMGIREIYIIGLDFDFKVSKQTDQRTPAGEILLKNRDEQNHFHPEYRKPGELWTIPRLDIQYQAFQTAKHTFEKAGGKIFNASRRTKLDVFPHVHFDDIKY